MDRIVAHSEAAITKGSTSFSLASRLFGKALREDVWQLYAWCRHCDDVIDGQDHGGASVALTNEDRRSRLQTLQAQTVAALAGEPVDDPAFQAFQRVALKHRLPSQWPLELIDGFSMDVDARRYETDAETLTYCWGVAGVVGVMMAVIMGAGQDNQVLRRAQDLGLAFQITNICRDIREDAQNSRVYLPADRLAAVGIEVTPDGVEAALGDAPMFATVSDLLALADDYYRSARVGLRALPFRGALAVAVAREVYRDIGRRLLKSGPSGTLRRVRRSTAAMPWLVARGVGVALWSRVEKASPPPPRPALWSRF
jgi:phytoene synthase